mmetsp:Transcript_5215/g.10515  ORF Transcript_5215/g.10515 Transcript_5215/m.10515 type:complete len:577 (-) Transcript_5215:113-1843(-)
MTKATFYLGALVMGVWLLCTWMVNISISNPVSTPPRYVKDSHLRSSGRNEIAERKDPNFPLRNKKDGPIKIEPQHLLNYEKKTPSSPYYLPLALHPVKKYKSRHYNMTEYCCQMTNDPIIHHGPRIDCPGMCHTHHACAANSTYPFKSLAEKEAWKLNDILWNKKKSGGYEQLKESCDEKTRMLHPSFAWCLQWFWDENISNYTAINEVPKEIDDKLINKTIHDINFQKISKYSHQNIHPDQSSLPPPGCSLITEGAGSGSYQHLLLFPSAKLAICGIYKVGSTQWLQFLRFVLGAKDYQSNPHSKPDVKIMSFDKLRRDLQIKILNDPEWKFATFLRDPAERLLSTYLDRVAGKDEIQTGWFRKSYNLRKRPSFPEFVEYISRNRTHCPFRQGSPTTDRLFGVDWCADPHWRPQTFNCGLSEFLPRFSYIGSLDKAETQSRELLEEVGLWDDFGKYYHWNVNKSENKGFECSLFPPELKVGDTLIGFQQRPQAKNGSRGDSASDTAYGHSTSAQSKLVKYYTPKLMETVKRLYSHDFELWDVLKVENKFLSGSELAVKVSSQCQRRVLTMSNYEQ